MKTLFLCAFFCLILRGVWACHHAPTIVIEPVIEVKPDTCGVNNARYSNKIETLFTEYCYGCHSGRGASKGINLEGYNGLKWWISNDSVRLLGVIRNGQMPPSGKIPHCQIQQLETWVKNGMPF